MVRAIAAMFLIASMGVSTLHQSGYPSASLIQGDGGSVSTKLAGQANLLDYRIQKSPLSAQIEPRKLAVGVHLAEPIPLLLVKEEIESAISNAKKFSELGSFFDSRSARPRTGLTSGWRAGI